MSKRAYLPRLCDAELELALQSSGAVLIERAKWCGKTSIAGQFAYSTEGWSLGGAESNKELTHSIVS